MTPEQRLQEFAQQVYLTIWNRRIDDITDADGVEEVAKILIWANLFLDELEAETKPDGTLVDWYFSRQNEKELGVVVTGFNTLDLFDEDIQRLVVNENRPLLIKQDSSIVSVWDVVDANQLTNGNNYSEREQRVTFITNQIVFSRPFASTEGGGTVYADVINKLPRLATGSVELLDLPIPRQLLILGTVKNNTLPDIVKGGLSPSYAQKYDDLLNGEKAKSEQSSQANIAIGEDYSGIGGV